MMSNDAPKLMSNYWALGLVFIPTVTIAGNSLVILSVLKYKSLHSPINYFIMSLAIADFFVALSVMPFAVYVEVNQGFWFLGVTMCDIHCTLDVTCSTASILLLVVISFDRYLAATRPIYYATVRGCKRVLITVVCVWLIAFAIASPLTVGLNQMTTNGHGNATECRLFNADFSIYSSLGSFFVPCLLMLCLYVRIFQTLRERQRFRASRRPVPTLVFENRQTGNTPPLEPGLSLRHRLSTYEQGLSEQDASSSSNRDGSTYNLNSSAASKSSSFNQTFSHQGLLTLQRSALSGLSSTMSDYSIAGSVILGFDEMSYIDEPEQTEPFKHRELQAMDSLQPNARTRKRTTSSNDSRPRQVSFCSTMPSNFDIATVLENTAVVIQEVQSNGNTAVRANDMRTVTVTIKQERRNSMRRRINRVFSTKEKLQRKVNKTQRREKRATKTLAIVLGVFLICWLPFFTANIINGICTKIQESSCEIGYLPFLLTTWLGYMNSCLNPIIYTIFNQDFRRSFAQLLRMCPCVKHSGVRHPGSTL